MKISDSNFFFSYVMNENFLKKKSWQTFKTGFHFFQEFHLNHQRNMYEKDLFYNKYDIMTGKVLIYKSIGHYLWTECIIE